METIDFKEELLTQKQKDNNVLIKKLPDLDDLEIYPRSVQEYLDEIFFIAKTKTQKFLYIYFENNGDKVAAKFEGSVITFNGSDNFYIKKCEQSNFNRKMLQTLFAFTQPKLIGLVDSFGFGDRLGFANPAHLRAVSGSKFKPILAQQSIRELTRTNRTPGEVMDAAVWAVFQEGYEDGFGADADHLKTKEDIDLLVKNGFKMFTFDPGEYVHNEADTLREDELDQVVRNQNWAGLKTNYDDLLLEYIDKEIVISNNFSIKANEENLKRALVKYGDALVHIKTMYQHLKSKHPDYKSEVEISVDETESVTSPFEHYFIANELKRLGVKLISLAPRFIGDFEKGIDYKGDVSVFKEEYIKHISIAKYFGTYKLSLHSGSDKFSVYNVIGSLKLGVTHVKTAGTSYLEALKVTAVKDPKLFREILDYSRNLYEKEKKSYHVSANLNKVSTAESYSDEDLIGLFNLDDARQILHVTFGKILTDKNEEGKYIFKNRIYNCLKENEELHYNFIIDHFHKHLDPFS
jgi:tagaturonate epimerase